MNKEKMISAVVRTAEIQEIEAEKILNAIGAVGDQFAAESCISISAFIAAIVQMAKVTVSEAEKILNTAVTIAAASCEAESRTKH